MLRKREPSQSLVRWDAHIRKHEQVYENISPSPPCEPMRSPRSEDSTRAFFYKRIVESSVGSVRSRPTSRGGTWKLLQQQKLLLLNQSKQLSHWKKKAKLTVSKNKELRQRLAEEMQQNEQVAQEQQALLNKVGEHKAYIDHLEQEQRGHVKELVVLARAVDDGSLLERCCSASVAASKIQAAWWRSRGIRMISKHALQLRSDLQSQAELHRVMLEKLREEHATQLLNARQIAAAGYTRKKEATAKLVDVFYQQATNEEVLYYSRPHSRDQSILS